MKKILIVFLLVCAILFMPGIASAHEVYVLTPQQINQNLHTSLNIFASLGSTSNLLWFFFFMFAAITSLSISFIISFSQWGVQTAKKVEKLSKFALPIIRIVFGVSLIYSAHYSSLFGP